MHVRLGITNFGVDAKTWECIGVIIEIPIRRKMVGYIEQVTKP